MKGVEEVAKKQEKETMGYREHPGRVCQLWPHACDLGCG